MPNLLVIILSLIILIFLHELGHFLLAKKYGIKVEEFGIGLPPRIYGKKVGETIYSINWLPLGGFVKLYGEDKKIDNQKSFSSKPIYQRALVVFGGVAAFFVIAFLIFSVYSVVGVRTPVEEGVALEEMNDPMIIITKSVRESPAREAGIKPGDILTEVDGKEIDSPSQAISILGEKEGVETEITVIRGQEEKLFTLTPRMEYEEGEGAVGIGMAMTDIQKYPVYYAPLQGARMTGEMTFMVGQGFGMLLQSLVTGEPLPDEMEIGGPVAIVNIGAGALGRGISDFLHFLGAITVSLAVLNILPIPALDGGRLMFLAIEKIKGSPISEKLEVGINTIFFFLLIGVMLFVTFKDLGL